MESSAAQNLLDGVMQINAFYTKVFTAMTVTYRDSYSACQHKVPKIYCYIFFLVAYGADYRTVPVIERKRVKQIMRKNAEIYGLLPRALSSEPSFR
jgi:hypothetical protein